MTVVQKSRAVPFTCEQMYTLVNEVEHYAEFLPYCAKSTVLHRDEDEVQATLEISALGFNKSFTTRNRLQANKMIEIRLVDGPFKHLEGFWRFDELADGGCQISFDLEFEFAGIFSKFLGPAFEQITNLMVDAFCERAEKLYA